MSKSLPVALLLSIGLFANPAVGQDLPADDAEPATAETKPVDAEAATPTEDATLSDDEINDLVKQLNDDKFAVRQAATRKLTEAGAAVIPALTKAAQGPHLEVTTRAFDILAKFLKDTESRSAAKAALEELAKSDNENAAGRASKLIEGQTKVANNPGGRALPGGIQIVPGPGRIRIAGGGQMQIQVQVGGAGGFKKVNIKNVNGVKEIDVQENGQKVHIIESPDTGIKMDVTKTNKDGKEETKKYNAKNADELRKNHPEAGKLYDKYAQNQGNLQIQAIPLQPGVIPQLPFGRQRIQIGPNGIEIKDAEDEKEKDDETEADEAE